MVRPAATPNPDRCRSGAGLSAVSEEMKKEVQEIKKESEEKKKMSEEIKKWSEDVKK